MLEINNHWHLPDFIALNETWIKQYFALEAVDIALADNPQVIIENGGYVFSIADAGKVVAACALFNQGAGVFQLARMAVHVDRRRCGLADRLMLAVLEKLQEIGASSVYLLSNTKLTPAIALYKKHGFETIHLGPHEEYARVDIVMEKVL
ncbi:MAG: MarR family transcriptional regulator [Betaproteobacteria bacterium HGW-Betaproteobacteria-8]|nr:MAG: MarR family transcriptional regulator [Betaproteobacteria bacterium HGW-Betaproteobacteria-8]